MDCIFCKIVQGDIPATKVYEDDDFFGFLDIAPINKGHVLIIPKEHYETYLEMPEELSSKFGEVLHKVTKAVYDAVEPEGYNIFTNNYKIAGQEVPHLHFHILPRFKDDGFSFVWPHQKYDDTDEMEDFKEKISKLIAE